MTASLRTGEGTPSVLSTKLRGSIAVAAPRRAIGTLRGAGFSVEMTAHAYALLDSYVYGFALSEAALLINGPETVTKVAEQMLQQFSADDYPHLFEFSIEHILKPGYDFGNEFEFGLSVILDALIRSIPDNDSELAS